MGKFCRNPGMGLGKGLAMFGRPEIILIGVLVLLGLHAAGFYPYLLFFTLAERFAIVMTCGIFVLARNYRRFMYNNSLVLLGIACLFITGTDSINTPAYQHGQERIKRK
jgi:hypothetical protein